ncbi:hypothetical protein MAR_034474, partial [Mya arenaria]
MDVGFASAVANICEQLMKLPSMKDVNIKQLFDTKTAQHSNSPQLRSRPRVKRPPLIPQHHVMGSPLPSPQPRKRSEMYRSTSLETRSRSPSQSHPFIHSMNEYYGGSNLTDRSRSPSPVASPVNTPPRDQPGSYQCLPFNITKSGSINFPRLNTSPTHKPKLNIAPVPQMFLRQRRRRSEKMELRSDSNAPLTNNDSDEDDDD